VIIEVPRPVFARAGLSIDEILEEDVAERPPDDGVVPELYLRGLRIREAVHESHQSRVRFRVEKDLERMERCLGAVIVAGRPSVLEVTAVTGQAINEVADGLAERVGALGVSARSETQKQRERNDDFTEHRCLPARAA
jgi:hypothetical protein